MQLCDNALRLNTYINDFDHDKSSDSMKDHNSDFDWHYSVKM